MNYIRVVVAGGAHTDSAPRHRAKCPLADWQVSGPAVTSKPSYDRQQLGSEAVEDGGQVGTDWDGEAAYETAEHDELLLRGRFVRDLAEAEWFLSEALAVFMQVTHDHRYPVLAATILPELTFPQKLLAARHAVQQLSVAIGEDLPDYYEELFKAADRCYQTRNVLAHQIGGVVVGTEGPTSGHYVRWRRGNSAANSIDADRELTELDRVVRGLRGLMFDFIGRCYPRQTGHPELEDEGG